MRHQFLLAALLGGLAVPSLATPSAAGVSVAYVDPANFTDAKLFFGFGRKQDLFVQRDLRQHLEKLGQRYLPADQTLKVEILDIDLAGYFRPVGRAGENLRVLTDGTWPRIKLRYTLEKGGPVLAAVEEFLVDQNYLNNIGGYSTSDSLRYEKRMLTDWFRRRFETH